MKKLRVAVVATGMIGAQHIEAIRRIPHTEVVAAADANPAARQVALQQLGVPAFYEDYRTMIETEKPDVVHTCTPNSLHYEVNRFALQQGCHVYSEKPFTVHLSQAEELVTLAKAEGLAGAVNYNYRNNAMVREMRARVQNGDAGRPLLVHGAYLQDWLMFATDYNWRFGEEEAGGARALPDIGSHWFDLAQTVCGQRITAVNASLFIAHKQRQKPAQTVKTFEKQQGTGGETVQVSTEDGAFITAKLADGTPLGVTLSQVSGGYKNHIALSVDCANYSMRWQQQAADRLTLGLREGGEHTLFADPSQLSPEAARFATLPVGHSVAWADAFRGGIREFYTAIRGESYREGPQSYASFEDGLYIMRLVASCLQSHQTQTWVTL